MLFSKRAMTITLTTKICDIGACFGLFLSVLTCFYLFLPVFICFTRFPNLVLSDLEIWQDVWGGWLALYRCHGERRWLVKSFVIDQTISRMLAFHWLISRMLFIDWLIDHPIFFDWLINWLSDVEDAPFSLVDWFISFYFVLCHDHMIIWSYDDDDNHYGVNRTGSIDDHRQRMRWISRQCVRLPGI